MEPASFAPGSGPKWTDRPRVCYHRQRSPALGQGSFEMKIVNSLKTLKSRDKDCRVIRRKGRIYVINKKKPKFKVRQG